MLRTMVTLLAARQEPIGARTEHRQRRQIPA